MAEIIQGTLRATGSVADLTGASISAGHENLALSGESVFRALLSLASRSFSGLVGIKSDEHTFAFVLNRGQIIHASSDATSDDEALLSEIFEENVCLMDDIRRAVKHCEETGAGLARSLHANKALEPVQLAHAMKEVYASLVHGACAVQSGQLTVAPHTATGKSELSTALKVDMLPVLADFVRKKIKRAYYTDLEPALAPAMALWLTLDKTKEAMIDALKLDKREEHAIKNTICGEYRLDEVFGVSILSKNETARLLVLLFVFDVISATVDDAGREKDTLLRLKRALGRLGKADNFTKLDGHWSTHKSDLELNFARLTKRYGPDSKNQADPETAPITRAIWGLIEKAYDVVSDDKARIAYRKEIVMADQLHHSADLIFEQAKAAEFRSERDLAVKLFQCSDELHPNMEAKACINKLRPKFEKWST